MSVIVIPIFQMLLTVLDLYQWCVIVMIALNLLLVFNIINNHNPFVIGLNDFLFRITDPILKRLRRILPSTGVIDLAPLVLLLLISFTKNVMVQLAIKIWGRMF